MRLSLRSQRLQLFDSKCTLFMWWQINFQQQCDSKNHCNMLILCSRNIIINVDDSSGFFDEQKVKMNAFCFFEVSQIWDSVKSVVRKTCFVLLMIGYSFFLSFCFRSSWCVFRELPFSPFTTIWAWPLNFSIRYDVYKSCSTFGKYVKALQYFL